MRTGAHEEGGDVERDQVGTAVRQLLLEHQDWVLPQPSRSIQ